MTPLPRVPRSFLVPGLATVIVVAGLFLLHPNDQRVVWERVKARHESRTDTAVYDAASRRPALTIPAGDYLFRNHEGKRSVEARMSFPKGVGAQMTTPFEYAVTVNTAQAQTLVARGAAQMRGEVLELYAAQATPLLLRPRDRSLIRDLTPQGFNLLSPEARTPERPDAQDLTPFVRQVQSNPDEEPVK